MSLKKDPNKKQRLECRNSKCTFLIFHEVDENERGIREVYIAPNKKNGFKHLDNRECEQTSHAERVKIEKWREAEELARDFPVWFSLQQEKRSSDFSPLCPSSSWWRRYRNGPGVRHVRHWHARRNRRNRHYHNGSTYWCPNWCTNRCSYWSPNARRNRRLLNAPDAQPFEMPFEIENEKCSKMNLTRRLNALKNPIRF